MTKYEFIEKVKGVGEFADFGEAERAVVATLSTLGERLSIPETEDIASSLPQELRGFVFQTAEPEIFHLQEFLRRVNKREGGHFRPSESESHARAVLAVLTSVLPQNEVRDILDELRGDIKAFVTDANETTPEGKT